MNFGTAFVPTLIAGIVLHGLIKQVDIFDCFIQGAREGLTVVIKILPVLVGLLTAIGMLKSSGAIDVLTHACAPVTRLLGMPEQTVPLALLRPVSGSGALAVFENLLTQFHPDSYVGRVASVMQGSTETTFYTIAVYYGAVKTIKTRYTVPCALLGDLAGCIFSAFFVRMLFGF